MTGCSNFHCTTLMPAGIAFDQAVFLAFATCTENLVTYGHELASVIQQDADEIGELLVIVSKGEAVSQSLLQSIRAACDQIGIPRLPTLDQPTPNLALKACLETLERCPETNLSMNCAQQDVVVVARNKETVAIMNRHLEMLYEQINNDKEGPSCSPQHRHWYSL